MPGLYIHVPFCVKKCHYCNFVIAAGIPAASRVRFLEALEKEVDHRKDALSNTIFDTVYLGGGTPSVLDAGEFERLFALLRARFHWKKDAEITCEANPGDVDGKKASLLRKLGVNRVSLGAQSFHDDTLQKLNRTHRSAEIESSFRLLRDAGFDNINMDLILSLPGEEWGRAKHSLEKLAALKPEHVSIYELSVEDKTVFGDLQARGKLEVPNEERQFETLSKARAFLKQQGYNHYELLNYAKSGSESRHNLLYWANEDTVGFGPGAYTYFMGKRFRYTDGYQQYLSKVAAGDWANLEEETLAADKKEVESFLLALRLTRGAELARFAGVAGRFREEIRGLSEKGLIEESGGALRLTARGQFLAETVFTELSC